MSFAIPIDITHFVAKTRSWEEVKATYDSAEGMKKQCGKELIFTQEYTITAQDILVGQDPKYIGTKCYLGQNQERDYWWHESALLLVGATANPICQCEWKRHPLFCKCPA